MAFKEAGSSPAISPVGGDGQPLKMRWDHLKSDCCPNCGDPLALFQHISMWKCACGFKISCYRKQEIEGDMELEPEIRGRGRSRGYGYRSYRGDSPF